MTDADRARMATSFGEATEAYTAGRPGYPVEAVTWLLDGVPATGLVADVGAGTGKLTQAVAGLGYEVVAVDPDEAMLDALTHTVSNVDTVVGTAEVLPLDDSSVDALVLGQAWHWVDPAVASAEAARVLRPGGRLGLIWNIRDERVEWVAAMSVIIHHSAAERLLLSSDEGVVIGPPFTDGVETFEFPWVRPMTREQILQMLHSRSYYITADAAQRAEIDSGLNELLDTLPELADGGTVDMPYRTFCYRSLRPDSF